MCCLRGPCNAELVVPFPGGRAKDIHISGTSSRFQKIAKLAAKMVSCSIFGEEGRNYTSLTMIKGALPTEVIQEDESKEKLLWVWSPSKVTSARINKGDKITLHSRMVSWSSAATVSFGGDAQEAVFLNF